jgi:Zn-dependent metalloprotease
MADWDWGIGEQLSSDGSPLRDVSDPSRYGLGALPLLPRPYG